MNRLASFPKIDEKIDEKVAIFSKKCPLDSIPVLNPNLTRLSEFIEEKRTPNTYMKDTLDVSATATNFRYDRDYRSDKKKRRLSIVQIYFR